VGKTKTKAKGQQSAIEGRARDQRAIKERGNEKKKREGEEERRRGRGRQRSSCFVVFEGFDDAGDHLMGDSGLSTLCVVKSDLELGEGRDNAIVVVCLEKLFPDAEE